MFSGVFLRQGEKNQRHFYFGLFDLMTLNLSHVALCTGMIFIRFEVGSTHLFLTYNVFTVDTLRHAVTLTFDHLNVCSVSAIT